MTTREDLARDIPARRFTPTRMRQGYAMGEVDRFLEDLVARLRADDSAYDVVRFAQGARFSPVRLREGYDMGEVDALIDEVVYAIQPPPVTPGP